MASETDARVHDLLRHHPVIDGHNDLPWEARERVAYDWAELDIALPGQPTHTDIPRLRAGGVGAQFWSVFVPSDLPGSQAVTATLEQIDAVHAMIARYPDDLVAARTASDVERGKPWPDPWLLGARLLGVDPGECVVIEDSMAGLRAAREAGCRGLVAVTSTTTPEELRELAGVVVPDVAHLSTEVEQGRLRVHV